MATHPLIEKSILEEMKTNLNGEGDGDGKGRHFSFEELSKLNYLHTAICESLRLYPPLPSEHTVSVGSDTLPSGHQIGKNTRVIYSPYSMGRMEEIWGADFLEFKPERWISNKGELGDVLPYKFTAFNAGPRACIGKELAMVEMKAVGAAVIWNYSVQSSLDFHQKHHLFIILSLLSLLLPTYARLNLDSSDLRAFSITQKDLGINGQRGSSSTPCNTPGVFCERRLSPNGTYVLKITRLIFKSQRLTGFLSPAIGRLSELKELSLTNNQVVGQFPAHIVNCKKLEILDLGNNEFSGGVPSELSSIVRLRHFPNLENLSLANNLFTGKVPKSIRSFRNLQSFDFSGNSFLEGPVPVIRTGESSRPQYPKRYILAENSSTTKSRNASSGYSPAPAPEPSLASNRHKKGKRKLAGWLLGFLAGSVAGSLSGLVFSLLFKVVLAAVKAGGRDGGPAIFSPLIKKAEDLAFLEKDDGLANLEIIGKGGCGEVYKAELPGSDGKMIAIKKIIQPPKDATELSGEDSKLLHKKMRQIQSEIVTVGHIRHRNLLPLLAHVSRPDCHYLVYELMKNGSLQDALNDVAEGRRELDCFGVVLGVLVMGKLPSDEFFQNTREMSLVKWMRNIMTSENPSQAIDPNLMGNGLEEQMLLVLKIACFCTIDDPKQRPNSKDARCMLSQIKH
ncbi:PROMASTIGOTE SURFACE ANTIGEN PROTEIN PSA [Salix purpurea]|uniref:PROMASTIGOTE SURFACE ANTIGEN PROTEIN PSA n=1 Tax=Salix purpurea TaxID=77065 RepID=A0A9Q0W624_SALPP|nr:PROMASTIGOTE SURFACE ANTIGEN PROTEIN PSA [Salix purpurea]